jgi:predicted alpha-1,2-mannosidase
MTVLRICFLFYFAICFQRIAAQKPAVDYVNVFTGTSNSRWMMFPGATLPFGMVKLSPDNQENVWNGGYEYTIASISGFSHLHAMGLSGLSMMPTTGNIYASEGWVKSYPGTADGPFGGMWTAGYRSRFDKKTEHAGPSYYSVQLLDYNIKAELTSTMRCGIMRLTYGQKNQAHLIINFDAPAEEKNNVYETYFEKVSATTYKGYTKQKSQYAADYTVYFFIRLNKAVDSTDGFITHVYTGNENNYGTAWRQKRDVQTNINRFKAAQGSGVILNFTADTNEQVVVESGISFVSADDAEQNLDEETAGYKFDFDGYVKQGKKIWNDLLNKVEVFGSNENDKEKFYTNLYRCYTGKSVMNDVNGKYVDVCKNVQQLKSPGGVVYSSDGLWGTQWDLTPLWTLISPQVAANWTNALLELADKGGWIPYAPVALGYAPIMGGQHQNSLIISAYQKGIRSFDAENAYQHILHDYTTPGENYTCGGFAGNRHLQSYIKHGYVADEDGAASNTAEYAYDDWCFAQFAKALGHEDVYKTFLQRSKNYRNIYDTTINYVRQRHADGSWVMPFNAYQFGTVGDWNGSGFMEGTPYQYTFYAPHDVPWLIKQMGIDSFTNRLEQGFKNNLFDLGNQPSLAIPFYFIYAGKPFLTQHYSRLITSAMFNTSPYGGWVGEEDEGQLSAYYVLLSAGLFEADGGCGVKPFYTLTSPVFNKIIIHLDKKFYGGKTFTIIANNNSGRNEYIQSATLNNQPVNRAWIYHDEIIKGGVLKYEMGATPNKAWGKEPVPDEQ